MSHLLPRLTSGKACLPRLTHGRLCRHVLLFGRILAHTELLSEFAGVFGVKEWPWHSENILKMFINS